MNMRTLNLCYGNFELKIKLPKSYFNNSTRNYPLLIVQDGDYLFKDIDAEVIFVGVMPHDRTSEYTPWPVSVADVMYKGEADVYLEWLTHSLIPYLKKCFNISQKREDIGIAGASFGGLVSLYALFKHNDIFGKYILISPSVWYPQFTSFMRHQAIVNNEQHIYWYVGALEGVNSNHLNQTMVTNTDQCVNILEELLISEDGTFQFVKYRKGLHRQRFFKKYFIKAIKKMY
ncbi:alpha/beta hydrolase [Staphylococcus sp. ACRSN]|uniref:alpha/beta hydrolase n=1 Tax=Staphylococcus sp. ACRSN TaxID=2918214 RepID=UPI001EF3B762|nr:alpha/beta hydrolase-fold protein [Staphylococcus sp. ACRSN]MCG7339026.1 alpha/beta hydrolase [Staphylococcus sp. ACRSN]